MGQALGTILHSVAYPGQIWRIPSLALPAFPLLPLYSGSLVSIALCTLLDTAKQVSTELYL